MIIARSPLRISFAGGGTDIPAFYEKNQFGFVVSTSITRHVYVTVNEKFDGKVSLRYRLHENVDSVGELRHPLVRHILHHYGIKKGIEIVVISDVPASGSGLGASSALAVALCAALEAQGESYEPTTTYKKILAKTASMIEIEHVGSPIGKQDHYASALGGFNSIKFMADGEVGGESHPQDEFIKEIESQSMLFYLNIEHTYYNQAAHKDLPDTSFVQKILKDQFENADNLTTEYILQRDNAMRLWEHMEYAVPERFMDHVNENWRIKKRLHKDISSPQIDAIIQRAYKAGATAAKVCGAGGGGFMYLMVPPSMQIEVRKELSDLTELTFGFDTKGVEIIFDGRENHAFAGH